MKRIIYPLLLIAFSISEVFAQQLNPNIQQNPFNQDDFPLMCRTSNEHQKDFYKTHPEALKSVEEDQKALKAPVLTSSEPYTIPVVFHVFGTDFAGKTVTDALIIDALNKTNQDFQGLTADWNDVSALFAPVKKAIDITFVLAKVDPNGIETTGINYYPNKSGFGNGSGYDSQIQTYAWDNYKYMNVYIMLDLYGDGVTNNSGVSWYPNTYMSDNNLARVVYNGRYLGANTSENFRRVLTHEFGHWLNLMHTFEGNCSMPNDEVADTPPTKSNSGSCNTTVEKCSGYGVPNGENFMDYTECYRMYTIGQIDRVITALENHSARNTLWQQNNLIATGVIDGPILTIDDYIFLEAASNNGSIKNVVKITAMNGVKFTQSSGDFTSGVHYNITNVPAGLSAKLTATSDTTASLLLIGNATSHANTNSINNLMLSFLDGAVVGGVTSLVIKEFILNVNFVDPFFALDKYTFQEASANDGSIETVIKINLFNSAKLTQSSGDFTSGVHYNITNVPSGLSTKLTATSDTTADFSLTGNASSHANTNDINNLKLSFLDGAVVGGVTSLAVKEFMIKVDFIDPYKIVYNAKFTNISNVKLESITCNSTSSWTWFTLSVGDGSYGAYYNGGLRFESYQKGIVCNGSTTDITPLSEGTSIGASSNWNSGGAYPNEHWLKSDWNDKTAYIGIKFKNNQNRTIFGWIQCKVNSTGTEYQLLDFAYNEDPAGEIKAGYNGTGIISNFNSNIDDLISILPNPNNGTFTVKLPENQRTIYVKVFNVNGQLFADKQFSNVTEIPINVKLAPGVYTLQLTNDRVKVNKLFIVE